MKIPTKHKWYDVIVAMANGKDIEIRKFGTKEWIPLKSQVNPLSCPGHNYRIVPDLQYRFVHITESGGKVYKTKELSDKNLDDSVISVKEISFRPN